MFKAVRALPQLAPIVPLTNQFLQMDVVFANLVIAYCANIMIIQNVIIVKKGTELMVIHVKSVLLKIVLVVLMQLAHASNAKKATIKMETHVRLQLVLMDNSLMV